MQPPGPGGGTDRGPGCVRCELSLAAWSVGALQPPSRGAGFSVAMGSAGATGRAACLAGYDKGPDIRSVLVLVVQAVELVHDDPAGVDRVGIGLEEDLGATPAAGVHGHPHAESGVEAVGRESVAPDPVT